MNAYSPPQTYIVTGAGRGIGKAIALSLADNSHEILCISKTDSCFLTQQEIIAKGGKATALKLDLSNYDFAYAETLKWAQTHNAKRIGIIAAAAILGPSGPINQSSLLAKWEETFKVNLLGNLAVLQAVLPIMEKEKYGRIIMLAGGGSAYAYPIFPAYSASKTAIVREVENLAEDLKDKGDIAVICLAPGAIETDMLATVRAAGAQIQTIGKMSDVITCVKSFMGKNTKLLSGCFVHVRDNWQKQLDSSTASLETDQWKLRRIDNIES